MEQRAPERALVFLNEEKAMVVPGRADERLDTTWYLDTGASNHMTGDRAVFATLDETITGNVRFGDGSVVQIRGRGTIAFCIDGGPQRAFSDVYYIPRLKSSVVSLGQLDELACDIRIRRGVLTILDRRDMLLLKVKRAPNRLYKLTMQPVQPVCLACSFRPPAPRGAAEDGAERHGARTACRRAHWRAVRGLPRRQATANAVPSAGEVSSGGAA
jgi:hypothetical protein